jgi:hypothetical protein
VEFPFAVVVQYLKAAHVEFCAVDRASAEAFAVRFRRVGAMAVSIVPVAEVSTGITRIIRD